jgi:hypothetical protein
MSRPLLSIAGSAIYAESSPSFIQHMHSVKSDGLSASFNNVFLFLRLDQSLLSGIVASLSGIRASVALCYISFPVFSRRCIAWHRLLHFARRCRHSQPGSGGMHCGGVHFPLSLG